MSVMTLMNVNNIELNHTDLDSKGTQRSYDVEATIRDTVSWERRVKLPYCSLIFYCCNVCYVAHDVDVGKVNDMAETPGGNKWNGKGTNLDTYMNCCSL